MEDEESGERVTPTGAAILRYLSPSQAPNLSVLELIGAGTGFGTRKLKFRSNMLRVVAYGLSDTNEQRGQYDEVEVLRCEIDDQTPEDLAVAIEAIRDQKGVLDVCQWPVFGKKGRISIALQVLLQPGFGNIIADFLFDETTTLGVRYFNQKRRIIGRKDVDVDGTNVKIAVRASGVSAKTDIADVLDIRGSDKRDRVRRSFEDRAIKGWINEPE